jgi:predicted DNA-binding transcriptional regulator YafY
MSSKNIYERFLWFDQQVNAKKYPNATKLAGKFEVSSKTAQRDIEFMRDRLNCPLVYDQTEKGYYYEDDTFSLPSFYISSEELSALLITRNMLQGISASYIGDELSLLADKVSSILKRHVVGEEIIDDAVSIQQVAYVPPPEGVFRAVLEGCLRRKRVEFSYCSPASGQETFRKVDPYHLFNYMGTWHLVGYCHLRRGLRDFNLARIKGISVLSDLFTPRDNFSFQRYFNSAFGLYKGEARSEVTIRFTPEKAKWVKDQVWHREQKKKILPDGSLELSFPVADFSEVTMEILKHGSGVKVIRPESLRARIRQEAEKILSLYAG